MLVMVALIHVPQIGPHFGPIVLLAMFSCAWFGGLGPGLFATVVFEVVAIGFAIFQGHRFTFESYSNILLVLVVGVAFAVLLESLHRARRREEAGRRRLSAVLTSIGDAVIATAHDGRVIVMNPVAGSLCGWEPAEAVGRPLEEVFQIINERTREPAENPAARVLAEGVVVGLANHTVLIARDGSERPIDDSAAPIRSEDGKIGGVVLVFRDVTERRQAEARVADEARRKDEFLAMLAHELRNPLAAVSSAVQLLVHPDAQDVHAWSREVIERQVRQLTRLVDDLLDISRISRGKIQLRPQRVDLAEAVRSAVHVVRPLVDERRHNLNVTTPSDPIELEADPARLEQVIVNLLNNAAKYTEPGGRIELAAGLEDGQAVIRVTDTGIGIVPELLPRVFELFTQGDRAEPRRGRPGHRLDHGPGARADARRRGGCRQRRPRPGQPVHRLAARPAGSTAHPSGRGSVRTGRDRPVGSRAVNRESRPCQPGAVGGP